MVSDDKWDDEETWERVADGPLTPAQLGELVAACDRRPDLWKRCALALLEEQALRQELQSLTRAQLSPSQRPLPQAQPQVLAQTALPRPAPAQAVPDGRESHSPAAPHSLFWNNLALAAAVMLAFGIGWQASRRFGITGGNSATNLAEAAGGLARADVPQKRLNSALEKSDDVMLASSESVDPAVIDRVNAETLAKAMQGNWKEELAPEYQQLRQRGYEVQSQAGLMPFWLYDGRPTVIPYQQIIVRPKSDVREY